jgi:nucleoside-diphosphate-sugar epimerase
MEMTKSKNLELLVVGGSGFIGKHLVKKGLEKGYKISVLSKNEIDSNEKFKDAEYLVADLTNLNTLQSKLKSRLYDYVVNLGGYINHQSYFDGGKEIYDVHFGGVCNLVNCLKSSTLRAFIQIGSSDEYGSNAAPQNENQRESPISPYSCAKVNSTHFLQTLYKTENFPGIILRPFLVYGPGQGLERFIPQIIKGCLKNEKFLASNGEQLRDLCYIDDFIEAIFIVLNYSDSQIYGEVINIASGKPVAIKKVVEMIVEILGSGEPQFGKIPYRNGENMALYADTKKAKKLLKWEASVSLQKGLMKTIDWVSENSQ